MQFLYHPDSGLPDITIEGEAYRYIFRVRRHKEGERIALRNMNDEYLYFYRIDRVTRREADLVLEDRQKRIVMPQKSLHIGWCIVDPKTVEKTLPMLNELGVSKISFVYCERSQKNFVPDLSRLKRILINSSQQCGRSSLMELEIVDEAENFLLQYPQSAVLDFGGATLSSGVLPETILVGSEGGFSSFERELFKERVVFSLDTPLILRSETAVLVCAGSCLF